MGIFTVNSSDSSSVNYNQKPQNPLLPKVVGLAQSLILGSEGQYKFKGISVRFEGHGSINPEPTLDLSTFGKLYFRDTGIGMNLLFLRYLYTFIHEMGHAIAYKCTKNPHKIEINIAANGLQGRCAPVTNDPHAVKVEMSLSDNMYLAAGPITSVSFASLMLLAGAYLKRYLPSISHIIMSGALFNLLREFIYFGESSISKEGDWGRILKKDKIHYTMASLLFLTIVVNSVKATLKNVLRR